MPSKQRYRAEKELKQLRQQNDALTWQLAEAIAWAKDPDEASQWYGRMDGPLQGPKAPSMSLLSNQSPGMAWDYYVERTKDWLEIYADHPTITGPYLDPS